MVRVHGESMVPLLHDGDLVGLRSAERQRVGDLVVAELVETNEVLVKLWAGARRGTICLNSINPEHGPVLLGQHEVVIRGLAWGLWRGGQLRV